MRKIRQWLPSLLLVLALPATAVILPLRFPFQGKLIDPLTNLPKNGPFSMQFKLYTAPTGGAALFSETQTVTVTNGVFSVQIGTIALLSPNLFSGASAYLGVTVGADAEMLPRQPLSMTPYAFTALQLVSDQDMRINAGTSYSTFTTAGNLLLQYGIVAGTATFATVNSTGVGSFGVTTSSGISMGGGTLKLAAASKGIDATGTGITASTGSFDSVSVTPNGPVTITADNTLVTVGSQGFITLTSNNATSTNRTFCLTAGRDGQMLVLQWSPTAGTNEGELTDGAVTGLGGCTVGAGAVATTLVGVWPPATNQAGDAALLIYDGTRWVEISRAAN